MPKKNITQEKNIKSKKNHKSEKSESLLPSTPPENESKLFRNILKTAQQYIQGRSFVPLTFGELFQKLHLHEQHNEVLLEAVNALIKQGIVEIVRGKYTCKATNEDKAIGILRLHPRGFGFVKSEDTVRHTQDIFIPKHLTASAVDGDKVEVLINEVVTEKGPEGKITAILNRGRTHLAGIIREVGKSGTYFAYAPMFGMSQRVIVETPKGEVLSVGDRIVMHVTEWGNKEFPTMTTLERRIGSIEDPRCDIPAAIEEFELRNEFPLNAIEEAKKFGTKVPVSEIKKREDLRNLTCFTIDPDTAKDFDDAISLTKSDDGHYHLGVHIADVSHYVAQGSFLDMEAALRCNSTYFPGFCLPMLPRELSDNLCSLKPNVNRLTASVLMEFDKEGTLVNYRMTKSVIKSSKRFTYKEAKAVLDGKLKSVHAEALQLMTEMCGLLKRKRYERGSIEFGLPELVVLVDKEGKPTDTDYVVYDITHQLVEEFMLKANELIAWHLSNLGKHLTFRVHDEPSEDNLKDFSLLASAFGFQLSETPSPKEIQKLFDEAMETPYGQYLATSYIRRMRLAMYSSDNIGHYGLSLTHYCHFTSPIRRYVDLVVHRILFSEPEEKEKLEMIAMRCSEQERISAKAENSVTVLKKLRLLKSRQEENPHREYEAIVTRVKNFGVYFEIVELMLESYLHVSDLENDYFVFDEVQVILKGRHHGQIYKAGNKLTVMLKEVDFITLDSKWHLLGSSEDENENLAKNERSNKQKFKRPKGRINTPRQKSSKPKSKTKKLKTFAPAKKSSSKIKIKKVKK